MFSDTIQDERMRAIRSALLHLLGYSLICSLAGYAISRWLPIHPLWGAAAGLVMLAAIYLAYMYAYEHCDDPARKQQSAFKWLSRGSGLVLTMILLAAFGIALIAGLCLLLVCLTASEHIVR